MDCPRRRGDLRIYLRAVPGVGKTFAMRRRLAHGNVYPAHRTDAALGNYFRPGNLTALRELALLWVADQVDVALRRHMAELLADAEESADRIAIDVDEHLPPVHADAGLPKGTAELMSFTPFQRLGDRDNTPGVGLGLSVAKGFTEAMGGTVRAEDTPGGGLTVVISLPAVG